MSPIGRLGAFQQQKTIEKRTDCFPQVGVIDYVRLMKDFLGRRIDVHEYRRCFFSFAKMRADVLSEEEDKIIQQAYGDADDFDDSVKLEYVINEGQLRQRVSLEKLKTLGHAIADQ
jgi:Bacterial self-protective colicin-like immunity